MEYEVILEKGAYALIRRGSKLKEYAVVNSLDKIRGDWAFTCVYYAYEFEGSPIANEAEMLMCALSEFRARTEEDYKPIE